jgi:SAM-dependent methyltransferase
VLGGAFTALLAPLVFTNVLEYPLVLAVTPLLASRPAAAWQGGGRRQALDVVLPLALGVAAVGLIRALERTDRGEWLGPAVGLLVLVCLTFARRPLRFALGIAVLLVAGAVHRGEEGQLLYAERSFFGVSRVTRDPTGHYHLLMHGTTLHGMQALDAGRRREPLTYFHPPGPRGQFFAAVDGPGGRRASVAVVGLGAGSLACYGRPGQRWTYYEIDPTVLRIAADPRYFSFLRECPPVVFVRLGDARLTLAQAPEGAFDLIILDAYSSDAPPMHLLTLDAVRLYLRKLAPGGVLLFNISNRHLVLEPVLGAIARAAGLVARTQDDVRVSEAERAQGKIESQWVALARREEDLGALARDPRWTTPVAPAGAAPWTDDFASLLRAFRWH